MLTTILTFIGVLCAIDLFTNRAQIIQDIKHYFNVSNDSQYLNNYQWYLLVLLNCSLCTGFWFALIIYKSFWIACIVSICAEMLTNTLNKILK